MNTATFGFLNPKKMIGDHKLIKFAYSRERHFSWVFFKNPLLEPWILTYENHFCRLPFEGEILDEFTATDPFKLKIYMKQ
jgi:hypothetical protein